MTESELVARLEKLERDNRRLKRLGGAALVLVAAMGLIAATRPVPDVIKAHEFDAVDAAGVTRVTMGADYLPGIAVYDKKSRAQLQISDFDSTGPQILIGFHRYAGYFLPGVSINDSPSGQPSVRLFDSRGFRMDLGDTSTVNSKTGATQETSADSILMFGSDKEHRVIWRAP